MEATSTSLSPSTASTLSFPWSTRSSSSSQRDSGHARVPELLQQQQRQRAQSVSCSALPSPPLSLQALHEQLAATLVSYLSAPSSLHLVHNNNVNNLTAPGTGADIHNAHLPTTRPISVSSQSSSIPPYSPTRCCAASPSSTSALPSRPASLLVNLSASTGSSASSCSSSCRPAAKRSSLLRFSTDSHSFALENIHSSNTFSSKRPCTLSGRPASLSIEHDERFRNIADMMAASGYTTAEASDIIAARRRSKRQSMRLSTAAMTLEAGENATRSSQNHSFTATSTQSSSSSDSNANKDSEDPDAPHFKTRRTAENTASASSIAHPSTALVKHITGTRLTRRGQILCFGLMSCLVAYPHVSTLSIGASSSSASLILGGPSTFPSWLPTSLAQCLADPRTPLGALLAGLAAIWATSPPHSLLQTASDSSTTKSRVPSTAVETATHRSETVSETLQDDMHSLLMAIKSFIAESDLLDEQVRQTMEQSETVVASSGDADSSNASHLHSRVDVAIEGMLVLRTLLHETARHLEAAPQADDVVDEDERDRLIEMYITPVASSFASNILATATHGKALHITGKSSQIPSFNRQGRTLFDDDSDGQATQSAGLQSPSWREERDRQRRSWASSPRSSPRAGHDSPVFPSNAFDDDTCSQCPGQHLTPKRSVPEWASAQSLNSPLSVPLHSPAVTGRRLSYQHESLGGPTPRLAAPELRRAHSLKVQPATSSAIPDEHVGRAPTLLRSKSANTARHISRHSEVSRFGNGVSSMPSTVASEAPTTPSRPVHSMQQLQRPQAALPSPTIVETPPSGKILLASPRILSQVECQAHAAKSPQHHSSQILRRSIAVAPGSPVPTSKLGSLSIAASDLRMARRSLMCYVLAIRQAHPQPVSSMREEASAAAATRLFVCRISSSLHDLSEKTREVSLRMGASTTDQTSQSFTNGRTESSAAQAGPMSNRSGLRISTDGIPGSWPVKSHRDSFEAKGTTPPSGLRKRRSLRPMSGTSLYTHAEQPEPGSAPCGPLSEYHLEAIRNYVDAASQMRHNIAQLTDESAAEEQQLLDAVAAMLKQHASTPHAASLTAATTGQLLQERASSMNNTIRAIEQHWNSSQLARYKLFPASHGPAPHSTKSSTNNELSLPAAGVSIPMLDSLSISSASSVETIVTPAPSSPAVDNGIMIFERTENCDSLNRREHAYTVKELGKHSAAAAIRPDEISGQVTVASKQRRRAGFVSQR